MKFISTRGNGEIISSSKAIINGIADDGVWYFEKENGAFLRRVGIWNN